MALIFTLFSIVCALCIASDYSGAYPPIAPIIKATGTLKAVFMPGKGGGWSAVFTKNNGEKIKMMPLSVPPPLVDLAKRNEFTEIYMEGFLLRDGKGMYWPTLVATTDGRVLIDNDTLIKSLNRHNRPLFNLVIFLTFLAGPFLLLSIVQATKIRRKLLLR